MGPQNVIAAIQEQAGTFNFLIRYVYDMSEEFSRHGVDVAKGFEYYSVMLCNPPRSYAAITKNPLRGSVLLPPKQVIVYKVQETGRTMVAYVQPDDEDVAQLLPADTVFQKGFAESCMNIVKLLESVIQD